MQLYSRKIINWIFKPYVSWPVNRDRDTTGWLNASKYRAEPEEQDYKNFELILQAYNHGGYKKGVLSIYMSFLHLNPSTMMNIKKIHRIMEYCTIHKVNSYQKMIQAMHTSHVSPNLVNRKFTTNGPRTVLLETAVTYH